MDEFYDRFMALLSVHATITSAEGEGQTREGVGQRDGEGEGRGLINAIGKAKVADRRTTYPVPSLDQRWVRQHFLYQNIFLRA